MITLEQRIIRLEQELERIQVRETVRELLSLYAVGVDEKRPDVLERLFSDDAVLQIPAWDIDARGKAAVLAFFTEYWSRFQNPRRYYANESIDITGAQATAFTYWHVTQERAGESILGWGTYEWGFRRDNDNWQVCKEVVHIHAMTELTQGWAATDGPMKI